MIETIKYHPLVDMDTKGKVKVPMFCSTDLNAMTEHHKMYLEEIIPYRFRLYSSNEMSAEETSDLEIYCPYCGKQLKAITASKDGLRHGLYVCDRCVESAKGDEQ